MFWPPKISINPDCKKREKAKAITFNSETNLSDNVFQNASTMFLSDISESILYTHPHLKTGIQLISSIHLFL